MGRELKRVPLDFDWELNKIWKGFINPYYDFCRNCERCGGSGSSNYANELKDMWHGNFFFEPSMTGSQPFTIETPEVRAFAQRNVNVYLDFYATEHGIKDKELLIKIEAERLCSYWNKSWNHHLDKDDVRALLDEDRLWDFTRVPLNDEQKAIVEKKIADGGNSWLPFSNGCVPTPDEVNRWSLATMGHDSINSTICVEAKCKRDNRIYLCAVCDGSGEVWESSEYEKLANEWEREQPPTGEGYQLWETVSEGSPISAVFKDADDFVVYLIEQGYSEQSARKFIDVGWVMSGMGRNGEYKANIHALDFNE